MSIAEEKALEILTELIKKPETKSEDIPRIWGEIISTYNTHFARAEQPTKKKRRRPANPNIGWPAGVKREEYKSWKDAQEKSGVTESLNPQEYKRQRDAGLIQPAGPKSKVDQITKVGGDKKISRPAVPARKSSNRT